MGLALVGTTLNHYRITEALGAGGMGEVYAAEDTRLHRRIALKVLPSAVAADAERRQRFEREALAIAALNHPNIVTIHSIEEARDVLFLTMELVAGRPLSELIPARGLPLGQFLELAIPLADAVSAAHQQGIVHRDLKPSNIMIGDDGRVKVLDFGLARLKEGAWEIQGSAPTEQLTVEGRIVGTVAYMSPEQAEGRTVDHRSDIFSLGIMLYEMATGERPFKGDTAISIISSIVKDSAPAITTVNPALPAELARIVRHSLSKDPARRYQTAADVRNELEELKQDLESGQSIAPARGPATSRARSIGLLAAAGATLAVLAVTAYFVSMRRSSTQASTPTPPVRTAFSQLTSLPGLELFPSLSPDGKWFVYASDGDIHLQSVGGQSAVNLTKDPAARNDQPAFSPDGDRIAFRSEREGGGIFVMGRLGESPRRVTDVGFNPTWSPDGTEIAYATQTTHVDPSVRAVGGGSEVWAVNLSSGDRRRLISDAVQPAWSPHGHRIAYWGMAGAGTMNRRDIWTVPAAGGEASAVTTDAALDWTPAWAPDGRYLYFASDRGGPINLWRVRIEEESGKVLGEFEPITAPSTFVGHLSFAADGRRLAYTSVDSVQNVARIGFDGRSGTTVGQPELVTHGSRVFGNADPSPDGQWVTFDSAFSNQQEDVFISRPDGTGLVQLTNDAAHDRFPRWAPDGKRIAFSSDRTGRYQIWVVNADGSGLKQVTASPTSAFHPVWAPDGARMIYADSVHLFLFDPRQPWKPQAVETLPRWNTRLRRMSWSPDGRLLAAESATDTGGIIILDIAGRTYEQLTDAGETPSWLDDSRRLLFGRQGRIVLVDRVSKEAREILGTEGQRYSTPRLSRDNRTIYLESASRRADVWLLTFR